VGSAVMRERGQMISPTQSKKGQVDISFKIGGRLVIPAFPVVDGSPPSSQEHEFDEVLSRFTASHIPLEPTEGIKTRERVLNQLEELSRAWIESVCKRLLLPSEMIKRFQYGVHQLSGRRSA